MAAAASSDDVGDDHAMVAETVEGLRPTVWGSVRALVPTFTLDVRLGDLTPASREWLAAIVAGDGVGVWPPISSNLDDRALVRAALEDRLAALSTAAWLPSAPASEGPALADAAAAAGVEASDVARHLRITPGDARRVLQGRRELTPSEAELLEALLGPTAGQVLTFDPGLIVELDLPEHRPALHEHAVAHHQGDEVGARRAVAGRMMAIAARHRQPGSRNWKALITDALRPG
jgi:plasmid maintenance system antidote protein VapI